jgi:hypothetical protein
MAVKKPVNTKPTSLEYTERIENAFVLIRKMNWGKRKPPSFNMIRQAADQHKLRVETLIKIGGYNMKT